MGGVKDRSSELIEKGKESEKAGRYQEAISYYEEAGKLNPFIPVEGLISEVERKARKGEKGEEGKEEEKRLGEAGKIERRRTEEKQRKEKFTFSKVRSIVATIIVTFIIAYSIGYFIDDFSAKDPKSDSVKDLKSDITSTTSNKKNELELPSASEEPDAKGPVTFNFGSIPFGKSVDEILKRGIEGAKEVKESTDLTVWSIEKYRGLRSHFNHWELALNSNFVRRFLVSYSEEKDVSYADLFFVRGFNSQEPYTLFLVCKSPSGKGVDLNENYFNGMKNGITQRVGIPPKVYNTTYYNSVGLSDCPAIFSVWSLKDSNIFLMAAWIGNLEIIYVSKNGWEKCLSHADSERSKQEIRGKKAIDGF